MKTSCLIPCYNAAPYLSRCLKSVSEFDEVVLWDDGSSDESIHVARKFPIKIFQSHRAGCQQTRNNLFDVCSAEAIAYLDADDERVAGSLTGQLKLLKDVDVVLSPVIVEGRTLELNKDPYSNVLGMMMQTNGFLIRASALERLKKQQGYLWRPEIAMRQEYWFLFDLLRSGASVAIATEPAATYYLNQGWSSKVSKVEMLDGYLMLKQSVERWLSDRLSSDHKAIARCVESAYRQLVETERVNRDRGGLHGRNTEPPDQTHKAQQQESEH